MVAPPWQRVRVAFIVSGQAQLVNNLRADWNVKIAKRSEKAESKNRPVATNFQFLKILCPFGTALLQRSRVFEVFLLGRACPRPCWKRVQQTGGYRLFFILLKVRTTQTAITTAATIKSISLWKCRLNNNKTSMICKIGNNFLIYFSSSNSYLLN